MRTKNIWLLSVLTALLFTVACGSDDDDKNNNSNHENNVEVDAGDNNGDQDTGDNNDNNENNDVTDPLAEVDVLADGTNTDPDAALVFEPGQTVGGVLGSSTGTEEDYDIHYFKAELTAGTVLNVEFTVVGEGFESEDGPLALAAIFDEDGYVYRYLVSFEGMKRQVFIPQTGTYYLEIHDDRAGYEAHGGSQSYYALKTSVSDLQVESMTAPGEVTGDMSDANVRAYSFVAPEDGIVLAETFAFIEGENHLDTVLFAWHPTTSEVLAYNDDIDYDNGVVDSEVAFEVEKDVTYVLVLDYFDNTDPAEFELAVNVTDDHPSYPGVLTVDEEASGVIDAARDGVADVDYFVVEIKAGERLRVEVTGDDAMQPAVHVYDDWGYPVGLGLAVGNRAGIEFAHPSDQETTEYYVLIDDQRNLPLEEGDVSENVGGAAFGYTVKATVATVGVEESTFPVFDSATLDDVGVTLWYEVTVPANHIVQLAVTGDAEDFEPYVGQVVEGGYEWMMESPTAYISGEEAVTMVFGVRDRYFRGGDAYDVDVQLVAYDLGEHEYTPVADTAENVSVETALAVTLPVEISGDLAGQSEDNLDADYFKVTLEAGKSLIARAHSSVGADMIMRLIKADGTTAIENDFYFGQNQTYYSALVYDVLEDGEYTLEVRPYCDEVYDNECAGNGDYTVKAFVTDTVTP